MTAVLILHTVFGILGNATGLFLFLAPTITFKIIITNKSTEKFSGIPYPMTFLNCCLSAWYGLPFVSENNELVLVINGAGAVIESVYVVIFVMYAPKKERMKVFWLVVFVVSTFATVAVVSVFVVTGKTRRWFCGCVAAVFSVIMYASPLSVVRTVIRTKSVEFMPFFLSLCIFLCGTSWFIFGLLGNDPFLYVCNGVGCFLGAVQLVVYTMYKDNTGEKEEKQAVEEGGLAVETGLVDEDQQPEEGKLEAAVPSLENSQV
ncbi:bidirectional sugar transporter SWEET1-like [Bidens hawaiensis]|uniref:bidirectional sugar transporter SWEET1-like n=1 Tax=Bidens hawaiensis TaxID=980011 RepID=UPI00404B1BD7